MRTHGHSSLLSEDIEEDHQEHNNTLNGLSCYSNRPDCFDESGYEDERTLRFTPSYRLADASKEEATMQPPACRARFTVHSIKNDRLDSALLDAHQLAHTVFGQVHEADELTWVELDGSSNVKYLVDVLQERVGIHMIALQTLLDRDCRSGYPCVERLPGGWTVWSSMLPTITCDRRVAFAAVCSARIVISSVSVDDDDNPPVGGWWKSRRPSFSTSPETCDTLPGAIATRKRRHRCQLCCVGADNEEVGLRRRNYGHQVDILRYPLLDGQREGDDYEPKWFEEDPSQSLARQLAADDVLRERAVRLGGAYVCCQLVEIAVCLARENFQDFEDTISKLTQVCTDAKPGWRHRRVRFNRTVGMLLEAGKARAQIARMREYYEQAHLVARSAAGLWTSSNAVSRSLHKGAAESKTAQWRIFADIHSELEPWLRHVQNHAYGDLRRLHQQDNLLHSYVVLARLRHEDDYNRITVLLSLIATIFLPLSFVTGVFGMNFTKLPLRSYQWSFVAFLGLSVSIILVALFSFWYRGWLNVVKSTGIYRGRDFAGSPILV